MKCLGSEERIRRGMGMAVSRQSPENALKKRRRRSRRACLETLSLLHSLSFFCFYDFVFRGRGACFLKTFSKQMSKEGYLLVSVTLGGGEAEQRPAVKSARDLCRYLCFTGSSGRDLLLKKGGPFNFRVHPQSQAQLSHDGDFTFTLSNDTVDF